MYTKSIFMTTFLLTCFCTALTTLNEAQATRLEADFSSYAASVSADPSVSSLLSAVTAALGPSRASSLSAAVAHSTLEVDLVSWAQNPSSVAAKENTAWETALPTSLRNQYNALVTSQVVAEASIIRQDLGIKTNAAVGREVDVAGVVAGMVAVGVAVGMVIL